MFVVVAVVVVVLVVVVDVVAGVVVVLVVGADVVVDVVVVDVVVLDIVMRIVLLATMDTCPGKPTMARFATQNTAYSLPLVRPEKVNGESSPLSSKSSADPSSETSVVVHVNVGDDAPSSSHVNATVRLPAAASTTGAGGTGLGPTRMAPVVPLYALSGSRPTSELQRAQLTSFDRDGTRRKLRIRSESRPETDPERVTMSPSLGTAEQDSRSAKESAKFRPTVRVSAAWSYWTTPTTGVSGHGTTGMTMSLSAVAWTRRHSH